MKIYKKILRMLIIGSLFSRLDGMQKLFDLLSKGLSDYGDAVMGPCGGQQDWTSDDDDNSSHSDNDISVTERIQHLWHHQTTTPNIPNGSLAEIISSSDFTCPACLRERLKQNKNDLEAFYQNCNPLHWAITTKKNDFVKILLEHNANVQATTGENPSPIYPLGLAIRENIDALDVLLTHHADPNKAIKDDDSATPLALAIQQKLFDCVYDLIYYGAHITQTVIDIAQQNNFLDELRACIEVVNSTGENTNRQQITTVAGQALQPNPTHNYRRQFQDEEYNSLAGFLNTTNSKSRPTQQKIDNIS